MVDLNLHGEVRRHEHVQPRDQVSDLEDDQGEAGAEEALEEVAHHVVGGRHLYRKEEGTERSAKGASHTRGYCGTVHGLFEGLVATNVSKELPLSHPLGNAGAQMDEGPLSPYWHASDQSCHESNDLGDSRIKVEILGDRDTRNDGLDLGDTGAFHLSANEYSTNPMKHIVAYDMETAIIMNRTTQTTYIR
jgi:hypothetical protein